MLSSYIRSLLSIGICTFLCENTVSNKKLSRGLNLISSLCIFIVVISPVFSLFTKGNILNFFDNTNIEATEHEAYTDFYSLIEDETEKKISDEMSASLGINTADVIIDIVTDGEELNIRQINVILNKEDIQKAGTVSDYLLNIFGSSAKITVTEKINEQ